MILFENFEINNYLLLLCSTTLTIFIAQYYYKYFTRDNPLPGPLPFPFVGNLLQLYWWFEGNKPFSEYNHKKYGDIYEIYLNRRIIILCRTEYIEKLLTPTTKNSHGIKLPDCEGFDELGIGGKGLVLNNNFVSWKFNRQFFTQAILLPKFTNEAIDWTNKLFDELESYWNKLYLKEEIGKDRLDMLDFAIWFRHFTNDMIIKLLTGERSYSMAAYFNTLGDEKAEYPTAIIDDSVKLVKAFHKQLLGFLFFLFVPSFLRHYVPFFKDKANDLIQNTKFINQRMDEIIERRRQEIENTSLDKPLPNDMLTSVITANTPRSVNFTKTFEETMRPMTNTEIRSIMLDGFIGGTDTTANTLSFIIYHLAHNPDVKKKMLEEIDRIFRGDKTRPITEDDFHNLKYCEAIVKEVSRVCPAVNSFSRCIDKPEEIAGYQWPAGTMFRIDIEAITNNKDYWEDPDKFNPDRWLVEGFEPKKYSFIIFGGGVRICPGRKLAMIELVCLIALLFRKYEIDLIDMKAPLKTESAATTACTELLVKIKLRN